MLKPTSFFEYNGKFFYVLLQEKGKHKPNFPIACLNTGLGYRQEEFLEEKIKLIECDISLLEKLSPEGVNTRFLQVEPGTIFLNYNKPKNQWLPFLRLVDDINTPSASIFQETSRGYPISHFAINLVKGNLAFGVPLAAQYEMENHIVRPVARDIKTILGIQ